MTGFEDAEVALCYVSAVGDPDSVQQKHDREGEETSAQNRGVNGILLVAAMLDLGGLGPGYNWRPQGGYKDGEMVVGVGKHCEAGSRSKYEHGKWVVGDG